MRTDTDSITSTIRQLVFALIWQCLCFTPKLRKAEVYARIFPSLATIEQLTSSIGLCFAPGLIELLNCSTVPTTAYFKTLPTNGTKRWAVYLLVLEKAECRPRVYIGSATNARWGVVERWGQYRSGNNLPVLVEEAIEDGYTITHYGLLVTMPISTMSNLGPLRALFKALEASLTHHLSALVRSSKHYIALHDPWVNVPLDYDPLCSHSSLAEGVRDGNDDRSPEELAALTAEKEERRRLNLREYKREWAAARRNDPELAEGFLANARERTAAYKARDPVRVNALKVDNYNKHKDERTYICDICNVPCGKKSGLELHKKTKDHLTRAASITPVRSKASTFTLKTHRNNIAARKFVCPVCDMARPSPSALKAHYKSKAHIKKAVAVGVDPENPDVLLAAETDDACVGSEDAEDLQAVTETDLSELTDGCCDGCIPMPSPSLSYVFLFEPFKSPLSISLSSNVSLVCFWNALLTTSRPMGPQGRQEGHCQLYRLFLQP